MDVKINNITPQYEDGEITGMRVYFSGKLGNDEISLSGYMPFNNEDAGAFVQIDLAEEAVKQEIADRIVNGDDLTEGAD